MRQEQWDERLQKTKKWKTLIFHELLDSKAFRDLKYAPTIKCLIWFYEKVEVRVDKRKRGEKRYQPINGGEISFTYQEALLRGLSNDQFSRALKELYQFGFIDVKRHGSGLQGDYTVFVLSERWRDYMTSRFIKKNFPKSSYYGRRKPSRSKDYVLIKTEEGRLVIRKRVKDSPNVPRKIIHRKRDFRNLQR